MNRQQLTTKLSTVTTELLRDKGYISFVEVFMKLGYLDQADYEDWRRRRISHLERVIKVNLSKINFIMRAVRKNSLNGGIRPSWTGYKSWGKGRKTLLRFSKSGQETIEKTYATHFVGGKRKTEEARCSRNARLRHRMRNRTF